MRSWEDFEREVRDAAPLLRAYLSSVVSDRDAVDDLFQDTLFAAWRGFRTRYDSQRSFAPWLRGVGRRTVLAYYRKKGRAARQQSLALVDELEEEFGRFDPDPLVLKESIETLRGCVQALSSEARDLIDLYYRQSCRGSELSDATGLSGEVLKKRLQRARARVLACMKAHGFKERVL